MITLITAHSGTIIIASILAFIFGMIWYHPKIFGTLWMAEQPHRKVPDDYNKDMGKVIISSAIDALLFTTMALVLLSAFGIEGLLLLALSVSVGVYTSTAAKGGSTKLFLIDAAFLLCQLLIITAAILIIAG